MNPKVFHTLEFDKIIDRLTEHASTERGKSYCQKLTPITNLEKIEERQKETEDSLQRIYRRGSISFGGVTDVTPFQKRLEIGGSLNAGELLQIASLLSAAGAAARYGDTGSDENARDTLTSYFEGLAPVRPLYDEIHRCILAEDAIADDASAELRTIRRSLAGLDERIRSEMNRMLTGSAHDYLQDAIVTIRDNRYCLPVKAEFKSQVSGIVHDQSSSGQTLFIEPMAVVNLNNERKELELKEKKEIERILAQLSSMAYEHMAEIDADFRLLSELDFIFAKGKLAEEMQAVSPEFNEDGQIDLHDARHPLLDPNKVVPIQLNLGLHFDQLIVTGPNTGGKTVSLKTCGLLTLMGQAGLHIPAAPGSRLSVFHNVYADIGDEQSIEQSLSTFSSHMVNIIRILRSVEQSPNTALVLFDELCAGTDPAEGAALATSILAKLHTEGVKTMATTHYSELKEYALATPGVENAACEFSVETLSPTYRLLIGVPGKSNAFAISKKLGLTSDIIDDARSRMTEHAQSFEDLLTDLEERRTALEKKEASLASDQEAFNRRMAKLAEDEKKVSDEKTRVLQDASMEAARILKSAKDEADQTIRSFRKMKAESPDLRKMEQERTALGKKLSEAENKASARAMTKHVQSANNGAINVKNLHVGDSVRVLSMNMNGTIHKLPNSKGELEVQMGIIKSKVKLSDIQLLSDETTAERFRREMKEKRRVQAGAAPSKNIASFSKAATISPEIKLLGLTTDEAIAKLDKYIDDAYISHLKEVRIVHGKGTGALRKAVQQYLDGNMYVKEYHQAAYGEGDAGVTIARLG
ncbi:MAG: endonuclease MutS2 [Lachnospiraceae bacterium]|nr:endonuclease MutS2 [Lachnospiraceae bacterium]